MNLAGIAEEKVEEEGERLSLIYEGKEITNVEMLRASRKLVRALKDLDVKRGDRVILQMPKGPLPEGFAQESCRESAEKELGKLS